MNRKMSSKMPAFEIERKTTDINYLAMAFDGARLAARAGIDLDPWQADVICSTASQLILNCHRQSGKSTTVALKALHTALYHNRALVLLLSPSLRQSRELFRKVTDIYRVLDRPLAPTTENSLELELANGSRIVSLPGTEQTIRGFSSPRLVIVDEASRAPSALIVSIMPMLAVSHGSLALLSTPFGRRGFFYEAWTGKGNWNRVKRTVDQCPRIDPAWLAEQRLLMTDSEFQQEYMCEFGGIAGAYFSEQQILAAFRDGDPISESGDPYHSLDGLLQDVDTQEPGPLDLADLYLLSLKGRKP
jgi:hypothetical protein